jgi:hypothetical protein
VAELIAPLARTTLINGMQIKFEAIDPSTGAAVAGVVVSNVAIYADADDGTELGSSTTVVDLTAEEPLWAPLPVTDA